MIEVLKHLEKLKLAQRELALLEKNKINQALKTLADFLRKKSDEILIENKKDLKLMDCEDPKYDRLKLTSERIENMSQGLEKLIKLKSPIGNILEAKKLENGLKVSRKRVPIGVIGMIYEARPNVTTDSFGIAFKTQNTIALKGGSDAKFTNQKVFELIQEVLVLENISENMLYLLPPERSATAEMLLADKYIDVIIPRGSQGLIKFVRENSKVPVIETGAGIVHTFIDEKFNLEIAQKVVFSAKTRRPSVCNSLDTLLVHENQKKNIFKIVQKLETQKVKIFADTESYEILKNKYPENLSSKAEEKHFGIEFLGFSMSLKVVKNLDEALNHIYKYSSKHSESIISDIPENIVKFLNTVDAACVFHNTETGYSDGEELGLGAEIGISTQKLHARGPMGLEAMTSYKWIIEGAGQTRI